MRDRITLSSSLAVLLAASACHAPPSPPHPGPTAHIDEREDAVASCVGWAEDDDDDLAIAAGPACDPDAVASTQFSLCACDDIDAANTITSRSGASTDIGVGTGWRSSSPIDIDGTLTSAADLRADNTLAVNGIAVDGMLTGSSDVHVRGDARLGGMEFPQQRVTVDGTLTVPATSILEGLVDAGDVVRADVDVAPPCTCADDSVVRGEVAAFADFRDDHDDWPDALVGLSEPTTLYFGCGDHAFDRIQAANTLTIVVVGDTRLWIDEDIEVSGPFTIEIEDGASLDLFVGGRFVPTNTVTMGRPGEPDALRMWVGEHVQLASPWEIHGSVYAPAADIVVHNTLALHGAIFGRRFELSSPVELHDGPRFTGDACLVFD